MKTHELAKMYQENIKLASYCGKQWLSAFPKEYHDDVFAEARVGLWKACKLFDPAKGVKFSTFAFGVIKNEILHYRRSVKKSIGKEFSINAVLKGENSDSSAKTYEDVLGYEHDYDNSILYIQIRDAIQQNYKYLELYYIKNMTQQEIANIEKCSQIQVSRKLKKEREKLRQELGLTS